MSQAFRRLGAEVTLLEARDRLLIHDEPEAAEVLAEVLRSEGVTLRFGHHVEAVSQEEDGIHLFTNGQEVVGDTLLVAAGRRPNVAALDLDRLDIAYSERGIEVDDHLRTSQLHIYAAGDCLGHFQFTHYADWQGRMAARNALLPGASNGRRETVPWTTFTEPEVAHTGFTESQARERYGEDVATVTVPMAEVDRARAEDATRGFIKVVHRGGKVLGVTIVSERAGENITEWVHVIDGRLSVMDVASSIHVYPTYSRANIRAAGQVLSARLRAGPLGKAVDVLSSAALGWMRWWHASGRSEDDA
jgi:pyruvate/2-oxoglutarate dehydrogenase complex dihydrolipoamide dehydrogenase (E3) component